MSAHRSAVTYCVRADARRSWRSWVVLGLLVGLAAGTIVAAAAGARRTASAYQDLIDETAAIDGAIVPTCPEDAPTCPSAVDYAEEVRRWPGVADAAAAASVLAPVGDEDGIWETQGDPCNTGTGEVSAIIPLEDRVGRDLFRLRILEGRDVDPSRTDEAVLAPEAAAQHGVEVGDMVFTHLGVDVSCEHRSTWGERTWFRVVGIGLSGVEVPPKSGFYVQGIHLSPGLAGIEAAQAQGFVGVRLEPGTTFDDLSEQAAPPGFQLEFDRATDLSGDDIEAGLRSDANALWLVAGLGTIAAAFVLGPTLARHRWTTASVDTTLGALGWSRADRVLRSAAHGVAISAIAGVVALGVVLAASTQTPIGDARTIEPGPGVELDVPVFVLGWVSLAVLVTGTLALLAVRLHSARSGQRRTPLASTAARLGLPTRAVLGLRIGLEPGPGEAPVRSSVIALAIGVAGVIGVLVYTSGAQHLRETPAWRGVPWDDIAFVNETEDGVGLTERAAAWPEVDAAGNALFFTPTLSLGEDHLGGKVMAFSTGPDSVEPTVIDGRAPTSADEILVNPRFADQLDVSPGDELEASFDLTEFYGPEAGSSPPFAVEVVGTGLVPIGDGRFETGVAMTREGYLAQAAGFPNAEEDGFLGPVTAADFLLIDRNPGVTDADIVERLATEDVLYDPDPVDSADFLDNIVSTDPTSTEAAPDLLAGLMAVMASGVIAYGVTISVNRNRHDLAVVRALGLTPRRLRSTARWAAMSFVAAALVIAVPLGIVIGRASWRAYAEGLGVVPDPTSPTLEIVAAVAVVLLLACIVGTLAARWHGRTPAGNVLHSE